MDGQKLSFSEFQGFIRERYGIKDKERGAAGTFLWLMEEVGELASAIAGRGNASSEQDVAGEFADVLGWLTTLANIEGVDLEQALQERYLRDGGRNHKL